MTTSTVKQEQKSGPGVLNFIVGLAIVVALAFLARWFKDQVYGIKDLGGLGIPGKVLEFPIWAALVGLVANYILKAVKFFEYPKPGFRTGHDISLEVRLDSGVPLQDIQIPSHEAEVQRIGGREVVATLLPSDTIPNKDFVMKYGVVGEKPEMAILAHKQSDDDGWFMLMIQPKLDEELKKAPPRELVFLIDVSGSMGGEPTAKVKETMKRFFELTRSEDRLQVITFAGQANKLFPAPVPVTEENVQKAMNFTEAVQAGGGTEMLQGVKMVLNEPPDPERVRICIMLTDGYIGNEAEIIAEVGKRAGDRIRFWTLGIGSSPNRFLLDGVAQQGGGMSKVIGLTDDPELLVREIVEIGRAHV